MSGSLIFLCPMNSAAADAGLQEANRYLHGRSVTSPSSAAHTAYETTTSGSCVLVWAFISRR